MVDYHGIRIKELTEEMSELKEIFFDLETKLWSTEVKGGWDNIRGMGMSVTVTWDEENDFRTWLENDVDELVKELERADKVIGFNNIRFDNEVLSAYVLNAHELLDKRSFDMLADIYNRLGFRVSLDNLCIATLDKSKSGKAEDALIWFRQGQIEKVVEYCKKDVELMRELFRFGVEHNYICYPNRGRDMELTVEWGD